MMPKRWAIRMWWRALASIAVCALILFPGGLSKDARADPGPVVAAAASLRYALNDIETAFEAQTGMRVRLTYGATRSLMHQIEKGAPYELFLAADAESVERLAGKGRTEGPPYVFARGRVALVAPSGSPVAVDGALTGLTKALASGDINRVALANPEVAPYGRAAQEALQKAGLWADLSAHLVRGENVGQATQFATTGAAQAGFVAYSLAIIPEVAPQVAVALIPEDWHQPINHSMGLLKGAGTAAYAFADFLRSEQAKIILKRHGFSAPQP